MSNFLIHEKIQTLVLHIYEALCVLFQKNVLVDNELTKKQFIKPN